jgi:hypothetical protein
LRKIAPTHKVLRNNPDFFMQHTTHLIFFEKILRLAGERCQMMDCALFPDSLGLPGPSERKYTVFDSFWRFSQKKRIYLLLEPQYHRRYPFALSNLRDNRAKQMLEELQTSVRLF